MLKCMLGQTHLAYLLLNALAMLLLLIVAARVVRFVSLSPWVRLLYIIALALVFISGARLGYLLFYTNLQEPLSLKPWSLKPYGFSLYAGLIFIFIYQFIIARLTHLDYWYWQDRITPGIWAYVALGKLGCLTNSCCFGLPTLMPWGIHYQSGTQPYTYYVIQFWQRSKEKMWAIPPNTIHPVQLYESLAALILLALSIWLLCKKIRPGVTFLLTVGLYSLIRLGTFYLRVPVSNADFYNFLPAIYIFIACWSLVWLFIKIFHTKKHLLI